MKYPGVFLLLSLLAGLLLWGCSSPSYIPQKVGDNVVLQDEEEEYELIILDNGFHSWFMTNAKPVSYYSPGYYEAKNRQYVTAWNDLFYRYGGAGPFGNRIDYDFTIDYGLKLNYQLFWYFRYVEAIYGRDYSFPF